MEKLLKYVDLAATALAVLAILGCIALFSIGLVDGMFG